MSYLNSISGYGTTSSLLSSIYGSSRSSSYSGVLSGLSNNYSDYSYGTNTSTASSSLSLYLVGIKNAASGLASAIENARKSSTWNSSSYASDSSAVSVSYTGKDKPEDMTVDVKQIAEAQVNEGKSLSSDKSTVRGTSLTIETADGKSKSFYVATGSSTTNLDVQKKLADKINAANLGVTATVEKDSKTGTSKLVLKGETGEGNDFNVSGSLAEELGVNKVTQKAQDAVYSINSGKEQRSSSNKIEIDKDTTLTLKSATKETANLTYSKNNVKGINAAREFVNSFNKLYEQAKSFDDLGALKLQNQLVSLNSSYASALARMGISTNSEGYLKIDEDKMQEAAESGALEKFFTENQGQSYGFVNRLDRIASSIEQDPSKYVSASAKEELSSSDSYYSSYGYDFQSLLGSARFRRSYFNYISTSTLFDALF